MLSKITKLGPTSFEVSIAESDGQYIHFDGTLIAPEIIEMLSRIGVVVPVNDGIELTIEMSFDIGEIVPQSGRVSYFTDSSQPTVLGTLEPTDVGTIIDVYEDDIRWSFAEEIDESDWH